MKTINGIVTPINVQIEPNYERHSLVISYRMVKETNLFSTTPERITILLSTDGNFSFILPEEIEIIGQIRLSIRGPINEIFARDYDYTELSPPVLSGTTTKSAGVLVEIKVDPQLQIIVPNNNSVTPYKVRGRLINFNDGSAIGRKTLFIYVHYKSNEESLLPEDIAVYSTVNTDSNGYFTIDYSGEPLRTAFLKIAGIETPVFLLKKNLQVPDQLDTNQIVVVNGNLLHTDDEDESDCGCHQTEDPNLMPDAEDLALSGAYSSLKGSNCVDFTQPNRALEEFSYVKLVRTTEPDIKKVPYRKPPLLKLPNGSNFSNVQSQQTIIDDTEMTARIDGGAEGVPLDNQQDAPKQADLRAFYFYIQNSWAANAKWWIFEDRPYELVDTNKMMFTPAADSYSLYNPVEKWLVTIAQLFEYMYERVHKTEAELLGFLKFIDTEFRRENARKCGNPEEMEDFIKNFFQQGSHGRVDVDGTHGIDWDDTPTLYQNTTIAHGHLVHIKQIWRADGYSMGDLLYSLPLAPCQKKQIAIFDWGRSETAGRSESLTNEEQLTSHLNRDRDVTDIVNSSLTENSKGGSETDLYSKSKTAGIGGGYGVGASASIPVGGIPISLGVSGGIAGGIGKQTNESNSSSNAWQDSARNLSASSMSNLKDSIMQSASSVRSQRSTVIETISQNETMSVQTEVIANHNHCHSMTMEYFEVLRHFAIEQKVADVQECLFIPLDMTAFTANKILRWKDELYKALPASGLRDGLIALEGIQRQYQYSNPSEVLADELIQEIFGQIIVSANINRPADNILGAEEEYHTFNDSNWTNLNPFLGNWNTSKIKSTFEQKLQSERDAIWNTEILPEVLTNFLDQLEIDAYDKNGQALNLKLELSIEPNTRIKYSNLRGKDAIKKSRKIEMLKSYTPGNEMRLILNLYPKNSVTRKQINEIRIQNNFNLPTGSKIVFFGGSMRYMTASLSETLFSLNERHKELDQDNIAISTPLNKRELFNPVVEAYKIANRLIEHVNDHLEHYHKLIWYQMDKDKRFMLLDGFTAPNANGRSVASVIENKLIDIIGNNLVMPVARGVRIDPTFKQILEGTEGEDAVETPIDLLKHYSPNTPIPPFRISVPTRGVYAEAVMGNCNSCEEIDESRHWRFTEVPCGDEPTAIQAISTDSRRSAPSDLTAKDLAAPMINIQNAPVAPDPQGFAGAIQALTASGAFNNLTGLDQNQLSALAALTKAADGSAAAMKNSMDSAQAYAQMAKELTMHASAIRNSDKTKKEIDKAEDDGKISKEVADKLRLQNLQSRIPATDAGQQAESDNGINPLMPQNPTQFDSYEASGDAGTVKFTTPHSGYGLSADKETTFDLNENSGWEYVKSELRKNQEMFDTYKKLLTHRPDQNLTDELTNRFGPDTIPHIKDSFGNIVNIDIYWLDIMEMPHGLTENNIFDSFRNNFNTILGEEIFTPYDSDNNDGNNYNDEFRWQSPEPKGAVFTIKLFSLGDLALEEGGVVASECETDHWIFTTISNSGDGDHPVTGNRMFGVKKRNFNGNDYWTVYTMAIDGLTYTNMLSPLTNWMKNVFDGGHEFWTKFFTNLRQKINKNHGKAEHHGYMGGRAPKYDMDNFFGTNVF